MFRFTKLALSIGISAGLIAIPYSNEVNAAGASFAKDDDQRGRGRGQDKNRGRGGDQKRGRGEDDRSRNAQRRSDQESRRQQAESDRRSRMQQIRSDQASRRQQAESDRRSRMQQAWSDRNSRRQQQAYPEQIRRQQQNQWNAQRQQQAYAEQIRRQQRANERQARQQQQAYYDQIRRQQSQNERYARQQREAYERQVRAQQRANVWNARRDRVIVQPRVVYPQGYYSPNIWNNRDAYKYAERQRREALKQQKRYWKEQQKAQRRYERDARRAARYNYPGYYPNYGYDRPNYDYYYDQRPSWQQSLLPLVASLFGGSDIANVIPVYRQQQVYVQQPPVYYGEPEYYGGPVEYGYADYGYEPNGLNVGDVLAALPIAEIVEQVAGENEFVSGIIGSLLSQGYDEGYYAGQAARDYGYEEAVYNDPYSYSNGVCDPYSATIGENRRYLSEAYEQGYQDALNDVAYGQPAQANNMDLVSVLLNNVLTGV